MQRSGGFIGVLAIALILLMFISIMAGRNTNAVTRTYTDPILETQNQATASSIPSTKKEQTVKPDQNHPPVTPAPEKVATESAPPTNPNKMSFGEILRAREISANADFTIVVEKRLHRLSLYYNNVKLKSYHVEMGDNGLGDKEVSGDHKTPEGLFYITEKTVYNPPDHFLGSRWMRLSYPNIEDAQRGVNQGIIDRGTYQTIIQAVRNGEVPPQYTALGGGVGIHGGTSDELGANWTWGCVGLTNSDVNDFYNYLKVGTPVVIRK